MSIAEELRKITIEALKSSAESVVDEKIPPRERIYDWYVEVPELNNRRLPPKYLVREAYKTATGKDDASSLKDMVTDDARRLLERLQFGRLGKLRNLVPVDSSKSNNMKGSSESNSSGNHNLNTILFGPPGTGKTYSTRSKALEILGFDLDKLTRKEVKSKYDDMVKLGRIVFTTFHQSMTYEDFIEGIKPLEPKSEGAPVNYKIVPGIFKQLCEVADSRSGNFIEVIEAFKKEIAEDDEKKPLTIKATGSTFDVSYRYGNVFYVRPHNSKKDQWYPASIDNIKKLFDSREISDIYNPTYVKGILNFLIKERGLKEGNDKSDQPYILIIDEINRGNVSQIFGELITLIEDGKRLGQDEALEVWLPYSKTKFGVPANVFIIGTMNTADRSVEALDAALRRRFSFEEMAPNPELLSPGYLFWKLLWEHKDMEWDEESYKAKEESLLNMLGASEHIWTGRKENWDSIQNVGPDVKQALLFPEDEFRRINLKKILIMINRRLEILIDRDHAIGHSYFINVISFQDLKKVFQNKVIPLLQEYFYGDYAKIGLVLGKGFVEMGHNGSNLFASFEDLSGTDFSEAKTYKIKAPLAMSDSEFESALAILMESQN